MNPLLRIAGSGCIGIEDVRRRIPFDIGQISSAILVSLHICIRRGCFASENPWSILWFQGLSRRRDYRLRDFRPLGFHLRGR